MSKKSLLLVYLTLILSSLFILHKTAGLTRAYVPPWDTGIPCVTVRDCGGAIQPTPPHSCNDGSYFIGNYVDRYVCDTCTNTCQVIDSKYTYVNHQTGVCPCSNNTCGTVYPGGSCTAPVLYSCGGGKCNPDPNGTYINDSNCGNQCSVTP